MEHQNHTSSRATDTPRDAFEREYLSHLADEFADELPAQRHRRTVADALAEFYPPGWPTCPGCGRPALDGHLTCGSATCDETTWRNRGAQ